MTQGGAPVYWPSMLLVAGSMEGWASIAVDRLVCSTVGMEDLPRVFQVRLFFPPVL